jgi:hypothetical protein
VPFMRYAGEGVGIIVLDCNPSFRRPEVSRDSRLLIKTTSGSLADVLIIGQSV